jgi:hypothetical protein
MFKRIFLIFVSVFFLFGCTIIKYKDELLTLKRLGADQAKQEQFLIQQEKKFQLLLSDIKKGVLKKSFSRREILSRYGEPISMKKIENDFNISEQFVYRHPEQFFGSEKVYLFFDKNSKLIKWLYQPPME